MPKKALIPRRVLFGNPDHSQVRLSPNGVYLSYMAPYEGVMNVYIRKTSAPETAEPVTFDKGRGIQAYGWLHNNEDLIYIQDKDGDENWRLYRLHVPSKEVTCLTPFDGVQARIEMASRFFPDEVIVALNRRREDLHDLYRLNVKTGEMTLLYENEGYIDFTFDDQFTLRFAMRPTPEGGFVIDQRSDGQFTSFMEISPDDALTTSILGFTKDRRSLYLADSRGRNTSALMKYSIENQSLEEIASDPKADLSDVLIHPTEKTVETFASTYDRRRRTFFDEKIKAELDFLSTLEKGDVEIVMRTTADDKWIIAYILDDGPLKYYLYDRALKKVQFLFANKKSLLNYALRPMTPVVIRARDDLDLVCYLTTPEGRKGPGPLVLLVHGGPQARDVWGYDGLHQWLANRGYTVLSVNYRGSTGFGKDFINAGNGEWAGKMHNDLIDAVMWAVREKIADPDKVAIMGGSYGGYATLVGLTMTPDVFACGVDIVGPSNLLTLMETIPPYWKPLLDSLIRRIGGNPETEEGRAFLKKRSPLTYADKITKSLLIGQGANDPRVKKAESDQIVEAMQEKGIPVTYVNYPEEGHGFVRPENRLSFFAITEQFLACHLGGAYEPITSDLEGAVFEILSGEELLDLPKERHDHKHQAHAHCSHCGGH